MLASRSWLQPGIDGHLGAPTQSDGAQTDNICGDQGVPWGSHLLTGFCGSGSAGAGADKSGTAVSGDLHCNPEWSSRCTYTVRWGTNSTCGYQEIPWGSIFVGTKEFLGAHFSIAPWVALLGQRFCSTLRRAARCVKKSKSKKHGGMNHRQLVVGPKIDFKLVVACGDKDFFG